MRMNDDMNDYEYNGIFALNVYSVSNTLYKPDFTFNLRSDVQSL